MRTRSFTSLPNARSRAIPRAAASGRGEVVSAVSCVQSWASVARPFGGAYRNVLTAAGPATSSTWLPTATASSPNRSTRPPRQAPPAQHRPPLRCSAMANFATPSQIAALQKEAAALKAAYDELPKRERRNLDESVEPFFGPFESVPAHLVDRLLDAQRRLRTLLQATPLDFTAIVAASEW